MEAKVNSVTKFNTAIQDIKEPKRIFKSELAIRNPNCAGLDMHKETIWACISNHLGEPKPAVVTFKTSTPELERLAAYLKSAGVTTVAMESTGVYWLPAYMLLRREGLDPILINPSDPKRISGRPKTDRQDCIWICRLHQYGFLRASHIPDDRVYSLKGLLQARERYLEQDSRLTQQIIGMLVKMNIRLDVILSDITGASGTAILKAILDDGVREPDRLYELLNKQIKDKMPREQILQWLDGTYDDVSMIILKLLREDQRVLLEHLKEVNREIVNALKTFPHKEDRKNLPPPPKNYREDSLLFDEPLRPIFFEIYGTDLTQLPGIGAALLLTLIATVGTDLSPWKDAKHFSSWLGLSPVANVSAGFSKAARTKHCGSMLTNAFRVAAMSAKRTKTYIGCSARMLAARILPKKARVAMARKLAVLVFNILKFGKELYVWTEEEYQTRREKKKKERTFEMMLKQFSDPKLLEEFREYIRSRNSSSCGINAPARL